MTFLTKTRLFLSCHVALMFIATTLLAETMSAQQAFEAVENNEIILLDIRTEGEWKQSGVGKGAWLLNLKDRQFGAKLFAIIDANPDKKIGLICAVGGRSGYVVDALEKRGYQNIIDVAEGMLGSAKGPGWLKVGLPTVSMDKALVATPSEFRTN
ncbi:MAG: rhodanese-like domain-containing protein [Rhodobacteraceae bacterium]|nr:rhodanese-like domain-containing protein [Paracoccaceae bacterium]